jgi:hypothetical protein
LQIPAYRYVIAGSNRESPDTVKDIFEGVGGGLAAAETGRRFLSRAAFRGDRCRRNIGGGFALKPPPPVVALGSVARIAGGD